MKITIIGMGLVGGSMGLALHRAKIGAEIVGHDLDHTSAQKAKHIGAIDHSQWNLPNAVDKANLVILATPVGEIENLFGYIAPHLPNGCVVTDVASTKQQVMEWADKILPEHVSFIGGHPMAGKETAGISAAQADLFDGCTYCIIPSRKASPDSVDLVMGLINAVGARPFYVDAAEHDSFVAAASHLPFIAAASLVNATASSNAWRDISRVASTGFRDTTRLASGDPRMHHDICLTNRESIVRWLDVYIGQLEIMRDLIEAGNESATDVEASKNSKAAKPNKEREVDPIEMEFIEAKKARDAWLDGFDEAAVESSGDMANSGESLRQFLFGGIRKPAREKDNGKR